jgi:hypothetical protein
MSIDRSATARALAKSIAYANCNKPELAAAWAAELATILGAAGILRSDAPALTAAQRNG